MSYGLTLQAISGEGARLPGELPGVGSLQVPAGDWETAHLWVLNTSVPQILFLNQRSSGCMDSECETCSCFIRSLWDSRGHQAGSLPRIPIIPFPRVAPDLRDHCTQAHKHRLPRYLSLGSGLGSGRTAIVENAAGRVG